MLCNCCALASSSLLFGFFRFCFWCRLDGWLVGPLIFFMHLFRALLALACSAERNISEKREREWVGGLRAKPLLGAASFSAFVPENEMIG
jgi:hypothetical protein